MENLIYNYEEVTRVENNEMCSAQALLIQPTRISPYVLIDPARQCLVIKGRSSPENPQKFYDEVSGFLRQQLEKPNSNFIANFNLEYYNTSTAKCLFGLFDELNTASENGKNVTVNWYYEEDDEDMQESGEDYSDLLGLTFNLIPLED